MSSPDIPSYPLSLIRSQVIGYLTECAAKGWSVYRLGNEYIIQLDDRHEIGLMDLGNNVWSVKTGVPGVHYPTGEARNIAQLRSLIDPIIGSSRPRSIRLSQQEPATNFEKLAGLIGSDDVRCYFDTYLDDRSLANLGTIANLSSGGISQDVRILTSTEVTTVNRRGLARLSKPYVDAWLKQVAPKGQVRHISLVGHQRRYMLLSSGQTLILGMSLNNPHKDEAAYLETNPQDLVHFDTNWATAIPF